MELNKFQTLLITVLSLLVCCKPVVYGWGNDGHRIISKIAQPMLSKAAAAAVSDLLPEYANNDLTRVCLWADGVSKSYIWSSPLHYIDTPDNLCNYNYKRDCHDAAGVKDRCVAGAIQNYTSQLLTYGKTNAAPKYNLTEALLFLVHFMGDIHQPLHVAFTTDRGANTIGVRWYNRKTLLHYVWDDNIIETTEQRFHNSDIDLLAEALRKNITTVWSKKATSWRYCSRTVCTHRYAVESNKAACKWAYKGASENSTLQDDYFLSRYPVVNMRLAQAGVRLAATLNRIFG